MEVLKDEVGAFVHLTLPRYLSDVKSVLLVQFSPIVTVAKEARTTELGPVVFEKY